MAGTLFVVATPIGNLEDITVRALRVLREVSVIAAEDTRRTGHLLARYAIPTKTTSLHEHNEHSKSVQLLARLAAGEDVALVSDAGTPTVSDPGSHLIGAAVERGIKVEPVPGANAAIATLSVAGAPGTEFTFLGFAPVRSKDRKVWLGRVRHSAPVAIFYEAPHRIRRTLEDIQAEVGDVQVVIGRELTKAHEELVRGPISAVLGAGLKEVGEFTVVAFIGHTTESIESDGSSPDGASAPSVSDREMLQLFGDMTKSAGLSRREALSIVAKRHGVSQRQVYQAIERAKRSGS
jgi:16S rRNA (cytidine1402-2'-O)-methyltransferase